MIEPISGVYMIFILRMTELAMHLGLEFKTITLYLFFYVFTAPSLLIEVTIRHKQKSSYHE